MQLLGIKRMRFPLDVILVCIRWYAAYPLRYRHLQEMMQERGVFVDPSSLNRWAIRFLPLLEIIFHNDKCPVGGSWRMDETDIKVKGIWKYLYRAVHKEGWTVDFLLTAKRDKAAAMRFFDKAIGYNDVRGFDSCQSHQQYRGVRSQGLTPFVFPIAAHPDVPEAAGIKMREISRARVQPRSV
jgi:transposase-like protein